MLIMSLKEGGTIDIGGGLRLLINSIDGERVQLVIEKMPDFDLYFGLADRRLGVSHPNGSRIDLWRAPE